MCEKVVWLRPPEERAGLEVDHSVWTGQQVELVTFNGEIGFEPVLRGLQDLDRVPRSLDVPENEDFHIISGTSVGHLGIQVYQKIL